jgi:hypothetical protein
MNFLYFQLADAAHRLVLSLRHFPLTTVASSPAGITGYPVSFWELFVNSPLKELT